MHIDHLLQRARTWSGKHLASAGGTLLLAMGLSSLPAAAINMPVAFPPASVMVALVAATAPPPGPR